MLESFCPCCNVLFTQLIMIWSLTISPSPMSDRTFSVYLQRIIFKSIITVSITTHRCMMSSIKQWFFIWWIWNTFSLVARLMQACAWDFPHWYFLLQFLLRKTLPPFSPAALHNYNSQATKQTYVSQINITCIIQPRQQQHIMHKYDFFWQILCAF